MNDENKGDLHNQEDVNPTTQQDKISNSENADNQPLTDGTGSNKPVPREDSLIIKEDLKERLENEPGSLGVDIDGTNPGSNNHPMDEEEQ